jgi:hypothetical protein
MLATDPTALRLRLSRLLGMLGSAHDGEALNAARLADKLVRGAGLTWHEVLSLPPPSDPPLDEGFADWPGGWRGAVAHCLRYGDHLLTAWEREFLHKIDSYVGEISTKQQVVLRRLLDRTLAGGARP